MLMISFTFELATDVNRIMESLASSRTQAAGTHLPSITKLNSPCSAPAQSQCCQSETALPCPFPQSVWLPLHYDATMRHKVTLIPGEGIGPEVAAATRQVVDAAGAQIEWEEIQARAGEGAGQLLNSSAIESVRRNRVALKGPMATAIAGGAPSVNVALRKTLDLYANLR